MRSQNTLIDAQNTLYRTSRQLVTDAFTLYIIVYVNLKVLLAVVPERSATVLLNGQFSALGHFDDFEASKKQ